MKRFIKWLAVSLHVTILINLFFYAATIGSFKHLLFAFILVLLFPIHADINFNFKGRKK